MGWQCFVRWIGLEMGLHAFILALIPLPVLVWGMGISGAFICWFRMIRAPKKLDPPCQWCDH